MLLQKPTLVYILTVYPKPKISMGKFFFHFITLSQQNWYILSLDLFVWSIIDIRLPQIILEVQVLAWDRHNNVAGLHQLMGYQLSPFELDRNGQKLSVLWKLIGCTEKKIYMLNNLYQHV